MIVLPESNVLCLNKATMKEIVQFYLDNKFFRPGDSTPHVTSIEYNDVELYYEVRVDSSEKTV